jgi:hypothetical protein
MTMIEVKDEDVIEYLNELWNGIYKKNIFLKIINSIISNIKVLFKPNKNQFVENIKQHFQQIRSIGFTVYNNMLLEKEVELQETNNKELNQTFDYIYNNNLTRERLMRYICKCTIFPKYKSGDVTNPANFRYLVNHHNTIKILDRLWCIELINKCGINLPDNNIFKSNLLKSFNSCIINTAIENTNDIYNKILLDIIRAFDSIEWNILENLLISNLSRKIGKINALDLVNRYMIIITNRELYYKNKLINIIKGIPTGLPSSNIIFTLVIEEIIYRWMYDNKLINNIDFILNIYVDDIYLKILDFTKTNFILKSLIKYLNMYKLDINYNKSRASTSLNVELIKLTENDFYLGIPFTRNIKLYGELILKDFNTKKKLNFNWVDIYNNLNLENSEYKSIILGFMNYKLKPILNNTDIKLFIYNNYINL